MTCPHCGVAGSAHGSKPGDKVRCPQCEKVFRVMGQKIACPHCGVAGSAVGSSAGTKLRCPQCEKVFLLTHEMVSGLPGLNLHEDEMAPVVVPELPELELEEIPEREPEPVVEPVAVQEEEPVGAPVEVPEVPELEPEEIPEPEPVVEPAAVQEEEPVSAPVAVPELPELEPEEFFEPEPVVEPVAVQEEEPVGASVAVPEGEVSSEPADEAVAEEEPVTAVGIELADRVCSGCGESFQPELLQEVDSNYFCAVCQLRFAAAEEKERSSQAGGKLRGALAALILLGILGLALLAMMKFGLL
jgi:hypothetical protein